MHMGAGIQEHRASVKFMMEYCKQLSRFLVEMGVRPMMAQDIREYPRLLELLKDFPCDMMSLTRHIIRVIRLLVVRRDKHARYTHESSPSTAT